MSCTKEETIQPQHVTPTQICNDTFGYITYYNVETEESSRTIDPRTKKEIINYSHFVSLIRVSNRCSKNVKSVFRRFDMFPTNIYNSPYRFRDVVTGKWYDKLEMALYSESKPW